MLLLVLLSFTVETLVMVPTSKLHFFENRYNYVKEFKFTGACQIPPSISEVDSESWKREVSEPAEVTIAAIIGDLTSATLSPIKKRWRGALALETTYTQRSRDLNVGPK